MFVEGLCGLWLECTHNWGRISSCKEILCLQMEILCGNPVLMFPILYLGSGNPSFVEIHFLMLPIQYLQNGNPLLEIHCWKPISLDSYQFCTCEWKSFEEIQFWCFQNPLWKPISLIVTNSVLVKWKSFEEIQFWWYQFCTCDWKSFEEMLELANLLLQVNIIKEELCNVKGRWKGPY